MGNILESVAICLDTEIFVRYGLNFDAPALKSIAELGNKGAAILLITEINHREVQAHLREKSNTLIELIAKMRNVAHSPESYPALKEIWDTSLSTNIQANALRAFDGFLAYSKAIIVSTDNNSLAQVFDLYFTKEAPFGPNKKKAEFPDAFSFLSIQNWAKNNDIRVYIISSDKDLEGACKKSKSCLYLPLVEDFLSLFNSNELATKAFKKLIVSHEDKIKDLIKDKFESANFHLKYKRNGIVKDVTVAHIALIKKLKILELKEASGLFEIGCDIVFNASYSYDTLGFRFDGERQVFDYVQTEYVNLSESITLPVAIEIFHETNFSKIQMSDIQLNNNIDITLDLDKKEDEDSA